MANGTTACRCSFVCPYSVQLTTTTVWQALRVDRMCEISTDVTVGFAFLTRWMVRASPLGILPCTHRHSARQGKLLDPTCCFWSPFVGRRGRGLRDDDRQKGGMRDRIGSWTASWTAGSGGRGRTGHRLRQATCNGSSSSSSRSSSSIQPVLPQNIRGRQHSGLELPPQNGARCRVASPTLQT
jgi:hypothetical protein